MGADYLEQDVVASRDDELIVLHDVYLDRVTDVAIKFAGRQRDDGRFYVRDFDLAELRRLTVWERMNADGSPVYPGRYPAKSGDFRLNTLAEELEFIQQLNADAGTRTGIYPEIKRPAWHREEGVDISPALLKILAEFGYGRRNDPVFVQCFDDAELRRLKNELGCPFKLVQLVGENKELRSAARIRDLSTTVNVIGPHISHLYELQGTKHTPVSSGLVQQAHDAGLAVHPYTFRADELPPGFLSFEELVRFFVVDIGIDGLFTDFPDQVLQLRM
jgi:glycerophosphoryl diester phosphodiesterase